MDWISALSGILAALLLPIVVNEFAELAPRLAQRLTALAARRLPKPLRERYEREWSAEVEEMPGRLSKLVLSMRIFLLAGATSRALRGHSWQSPLRWKGFRRSSIWRRQVRFGSILAILGVLAAILPSTTLAVSLPFSNWSELLSIALILQGALLALLGLQLRKREMEVSPGQEVDAEKLALVGPAEFPGHTGEEEVSTSGHGDWPSLWSETEAEKAVEFVSDEAEFMALARRKDIAGLHAILDKWRTGRDQTKLGIGLVMLGHLLAEEGDAEGARAAYAEAIQSGHPDVAPIANNYLGDLLAEQGDFEGAQTAYQHAIKSGSPYWKAGASLDLGHLLETQGHLERARVAYEAAIQSGDPEVSPVASDYLGDLLVKQGDFEGARGAYERVIESGHKRWAAVATIDLGQLLVKQGDLEAAQAAFERALESDEPALSARAADNLGDLFARQGNLDAARAAYQRAIDSGDEYWSSTAAIHLGQLLVEQGDLAAAQAAFERALESDEPAVSARAAYYLGDLFARQRNLDAAQTAFQRAIDSGDSGDEYWRSAAAVRLARLLVRHGDIYGAEVLCRQAIDAGEDFWSPAASDLLGDILRTRGELDAAHAAYQRAIDSGDEYWRPVAAVDLGRLLTEKGDLAGARAAYQQAVDSSQPEFAEVALDELAALELDETEQRVLVVLDEAVSLDTIQVATAAFVTPSEAAAALDHLVRVGQAKILKGPDGRDRYVGLGRSRLREATR